MLWIPLASDDHISGKVVKNRWQLEQKIEGTAVIFFHIFIFIDTRDDGSFNNATHVSSQKSICVIAWFEKNQTFHTLILVMNMSNKYKLQGF